MASTQTSSTSRAATHDASVPLAPRSKRIRLVRRGRASACAISSKAPRRIPTFASRGCQEARSAYRQARGTGGGHTFAIGVTEPRALQAGPTIITMRSVRIFYGMANAHIRITRAWAGRMYAPPANPGLDEVAPDAKADARLARSAPHDCPMGCDTALTQRPLSLCCDLQSCN